MFQEITPRAALSAIKALLKEDNLRKTTYAVWWKGKLISPSAIISKHYDLLSTPIARDTFDTNQAQNTLLNLGFPIVDTSRDNDFFTEKELNSFSQLISGRFYNKSEPIDKNIGEFISKVIWKKTKVWRNKLVELGWFKDSDRYSWQTQSSSQKGNNYKQYTWFRIYDSSNTKKLVFFTVGVGSNGALEYKLDIQANNDFFKKDDENWFYNERNQQGGKMISILKEDVHKEDWSSLVNSTNEYFEDNLDVLEVISSHFWPEKRLMRIVWNDNNWQVPIERFWKKEWQGRPDKAHHDQYGFGFEEWLFNPRYLIDGYQYGYVRGIDTMPKDTDFVDQLYLYSLDHKTNKKFLIAKLKNVTILRDEEEIDSKVLKVFESGRAKMLVELEEVRADTTLIKKIVLRPNIVFDLEEITNYEDSILLPDDFLKIHRFIPNKIKGSLEEIVNNIDRSFKDPKFNFNEGNGTGSNSYSQNVSGGKRNINRTHSDITNDLHDYLSKSKEYSGFSISTEKTRVGNNLVDCAAMNDNVIELFEVKTTKSCLANIRLALGQVVEYALLDKTIKIRKLIIVGPAEPNERDFNYITSLKNTLNIPLTYWSYSFDQKKLQKKFKQH